MNSIMVVYRSDGALKFHGTLFDEDYPKLDAMDALLVSDCCRDDATSADWLLALECLYRRALEQRNAGELT